jgi:hypothetical protein
MHEEATFLLIFFSLCFMPVFILDSGSLTHLLQFNYIHKFRKRHVALNNISHPFHKKDSVTMLVVSLVYFLFT